MPSWCDLTSQSEARGRIQRLGYGIHELLHCDEVLRFSIVQILQMDTGEGAGVLLGPKTLVEGQREGVCPRHGSRERLRGGRRRCAFYSAIPGGQPCRAPQLVTCP